MIIGFLFLINVPNFLNSIQIFDYYFVLFSYYFVGMMWIYYINKYGFYIFEHVNMVMAITFITFSIEPMISMIQDDLGIGSFYVFEGCMKATIIYMIAMTIFLYAYYSKSYKEYLYLKESDSDIYIAEKDKKIARWALLIWCLGFAVQVIDLVSNGYSLNYIFSMGTSGSMSQIEDGGLGIFGNIRYFMITALLYMDLYSDRKKTIWILRILSIILSAMRGYRWIIVVYLISPIVVNSYLKRNYPKKKNMIALGLALVFIVGGLQYVRVALRSGGGLQGNSNVEFNLAYIWSAFQGNFDLYKTLYGAVTYFPDKHFYTMGQQLIYLSIVTIIPRAIWPGKPYSIIEKVYKVYFMGSDAVKGAWAYAQLTEFYVEFGIIGVIIFMYLFGKLCKFFFQTAMKKNRTVHDVVLGATMFPMLMQYVIRGYMPLNLWPTLIMLSPILFLKLFIRNK